MKRLFQIMAVLTITVFLAAEAYAGILVVSTKGRAAYKSAGRWLTLKKGQLLSEGTLISTGVNSRAVLNMDGHTLTIRPLTTIKVYRNRRTSRSSVNNVGLRYGRINARVKRIGKLRTRFKVTTPVATSSVRGTEEEISFGPRFGMSVRFLHGLGDVVNQAGISKLVSGRSEYNQRPGNGKPNPLLGGVKNSSLGKLFSDNITGDEKDSHQIYGSELVDNTETPSDIVDDLIDRKVTRIILDATFVE